MNIKKIRLSLFCLLLTCATVYADEPKDVAPQSFPQQGNVQTFEDSTVYYNNYYDDEFTNAYQYDCNCEASATEMDICDDCPGINHCYDPYNFIRRYGEVFDEFDEFCYECDGSGRTGVWLPEAPEIFEPFLADPRQICYSVGWRFHDELFNNNVIDVSFGDSCALYRWCNICGGVMQIELEGALWAIFEPTLESAPLVNADYYVGIPITFAIDCWSFRLRGYHISSHIGDEFLMNHPGFDRRNASAEYVDLFASYMLTEEIRLYYGVGWIVAQDEEFVQKRFYTQGGAELRLPQLGFYDHHDRIFGEPFFGLQLGWKPDYDGNIDQTYVLGYEFTKTCGLSRHLRLFGEFHDGFSAEGQFCQLRTQYWGIRFSYGY